MDAQALLQRAGWFPGRRVPVDAQLGELRGAGHDVVRQARDFLAEYSGLLIASGDGRRVVRIDGHDAARHADPEWCAAYAEGIGEAVTPVGEYSHMTLVIDASGKFWGGFDSSYGFLGNDVVEVIQALLVEPGSARLDRDVPH